MRDTARDYMLGVVMGVILSSALWLGFYSMTKPEPSERIVKINTKEITKAITKDILAKGLSGDKEDQYTKSYIKNLHSALSGYAKENNLAVVDSRYVFCGGEDITSMVIEQMQGDKDGSGK